MLLMAFGSLLAAGLVGSALPVAVGYAVATAATLGIGYLALRAGGAPPAPRWRPEAWRRRLAAALPFGATVVVDRLAVVLVGAFVGQAAAGWFGVAHSVVLVLASIPGMVMLAAFPHLARAVREDAGSAAALGRALLLLAGLGGLALAALVHLFGPSAVPVLFGAEYAPSAEILKVLAFALPGLFLTIVAVGLLEAVGQQRACAAVFGGGVALALAAGLSATWLWGYLVETRIVALLAQA
jgi:O-antigen/teichoic acid export membrane protein